MHAIEQGLDCEGAKGGHQHAMCDGPVFTVIRSSEKAAWASSWQVVRQASKLAKEFVVANLVEHFDGAYNYTLSALVRDLKDGPPSLSQALQGHEGVVAIAEVQQVPNYRISGLYSSSAYDAHPLKVHLILTDWTWNVF